MKTFLFIIFPFFYIVKAQEYNEITWNKDLKLKKENFILVEYDSLLLKGNPFGATSAIKIEFDERSKKFVAKFLKSESILSSYFTNYSEPEGLISILNHEQGHFDIAQIFALKMNLMYLEKRFVKNKNQLQEIYNIVYSRYYKVDEKYDKETEHNMNKDIQKYWDNSIKIEIGKLNDAIKRIEKKK